MILVINNIFLFCIVQQNKCVKVGEEDELFDTVTHGV